MDQFKLYDCGSNGNYQLGVGNDNDLDVLTQIDFPAATKITKIASGGNHTFVLLETGEIWASGDNSYGQCGTVPNDESLQHFKKFRRIGEHLTWANMACGWEFSVLVDIEGRVYSCGLGSKGELALGKGTFKSYAKEDLGKHGMVSSLRQVSFPSEINKIVDIKASLNHVILRTSNSFYGWGYNKGHKMCPSLGKMVWAPSKLENLSAGLQGFALGREYTVFYSNREIVLRGKTEKMQADGLMAFETKEIANIQSMWSSVHVETKDGAIHSLGNNSHGQKLISSNNVKIKQYAVGSEHGIILDNNNNVYCWGWGEHGNCGVHSGLTNDDEVTFDFLNRIYNGGETVYMVSGGCATTFVATIDNQSK
ncbi:Ats1 protein [Saccharomycopsis crataegensis]|uniref:Ats1 protein n=1 Tax=Saccharomycopsis crataegensis TaxID=43959 RepID=A0AAV5QVG6_9ASCO|nr:Ats1 protein [Saccharomycopsis crataegensis]